MSGFKKLRAVAAPMPTNNVDTDVIFPGRFLSTIKRKGLGPLLFHGLRYHADGSERNDFVLNQEPYRQAGILVAGENFGCGSSREHAPWALLAFGIQCIISTSFADIFSGNCVKNGILCIPVDVETVTVLMADAAVAAEIAVDLEAQVITRANGDTIEFAIASDAREKLLSGVDEIDETLRQAVAIDAFEAARAEEFPWL